MFFFKKNKSHQCGWIPKENALGESKDTRVKILGTGCNSCHELEENTKQAIREENLNLEISHIKDIEKIASYGVL